MSYRLLGQSGLKVSTLTLGSMMFGTQTDTETSLRIIDKAWDQGVNFIDTANVYNAGRSEEIVGEGVARHRHDWIIASKVGFGPADGTPNRSGLSRKHIFNAIEASLTRLGTDYLDIYYLHREDHDTPLEVTVSAMGDLLRQGKIRYWGLSNYRGWRIAEVIRLAERLGVDRPVISHSGCDAGCQQPCRSPGQAYPRNRMASGIPADRPADPAIHPGSRRGHRRIRHCLGTQQRSGQLGDRRPAHRGAVGRLHQGTERADQCRG